MLDSTDVNIINDSCSLVIPTDIGQFIKEQLGLCLTQNDPDYSCAYVTLETDGDLCGYGLTFTIGRGNDIGRLFLLS